MPYFMAFFKVPENILIEVIVRIGNKANAFQTGDFVWQIYRRPLAGSRKTTYSGKYSGRAMIDRPAPKQVMPLYAMYFILRSELTFRKFGSINSFLYDQNARA